MSEPLPSDEAAVRLEALLFAVGRPATPVELAAALEVPRAVVAEALPRLREQLRTRGVRIQEHEGEWQMSSAPEAARAVERLAGLPARSG
ncbi:MAG: SMC-Scp complex subunit ScpB [Chloroflexia bacterium]